MIVHFLLASAALSASDVCDKIARREPVAGVDGAAFVQSLLVNVPKPKSQFETTEAYEARVASQWSNNRYVNEPYIVLIKKVGGSDFRYDADKRVMIYNEWLRDARYCSGTCDISLDAQSRQSGRYRTLMSYKVQFARSKPPVDVYPPLEMSTAKAEALIEGNLRWEDVLSHIIVVRLLPPYITSTSGLYKGLTGPKVGDPDFYEESTIPVDLLCAGWAVK